MSRLAKLPTYDTQSYFVSVHVPDEAAGEGGGGGGGSGDTGPPHYSPDSGGTVDGGRNVYSGPGDGSLVLGGGY